MSSDEAKLQTEFRGNSPTTSGSKYKCKYPECGKVFKTKFSLSRHILIHTAKKQHECPYCKKKFSLAQYMKEHMFTHTKEKPYVCGVAGCQERFRQAGKLSLHRRTHPEYVLKKYHYNKALMSKPELASDMDILKEGKEHNNEDKKNLEPSPGAAIPQESNKDAPLLKLDLAQEIPACAINATNTQRGFGRDYSRQNSGTTAGIRTPVRKDSDPLDIPPAYLCEGKAPCSWEEVPKTELPPIENILEVLPQKKVTPETFLGSIPSSSTEFAQQDALAYILQRQLPLPTKKLSSGLQSQLKDSLTDYDYARTLEIQRKGTINTSFEAIIEKGVNSFETGDNQDMCKDIKK